MISLNNYRYRIFFTAAATAFFTVIFILEPSVIINGIRSGLHICSSSVIPSLFPFLVLSDFTVRSGLGGMAGEKISPVTEKLFRLPGAAGCAVMMSLVGGFPVGAKMAAQLYENGEITQSQGRRMLTFCVNAGPAFVVGTVGSVMLSSRKAGVLLLVSLTVTAICEGIAAGLFSDKAEIRVHRKKPDFNPSVLTESVSQAVQTMFGICAWIMLFSGLNSLLSRLPVSDSAAAWLSMLTEVTNGCISASGRFPVCVLALTLGWSGLAVHCQILPFLQTLGMKLRFFWISRLITGGAACALSWLLFRLFPCEVSVFSSSAEIISKPVSVSVPVSAAMLLLSALMLLDIKPCTSEKDVI